MATTIIVNARILTLAGSSGPRRGAELANLGVLDPGWIHVEGDRIVGVGAGPFPSEEVAPDTAGDLIDAAGGVVLPAWIDCHTHACWAGDRFDEFEASVRGASYLDILRAGGGIMSTVRAVRAASEDDLLEGLGHRLERMATLGTATVEVKSGYGLETEAELRMLRAIHAASQLVPSTVIGSFLGAHAKDPERADFVDETISDTLPAVVQEFPGITVDAYCEDGAWSVDECRRLFEAAIDLGCPFRVHADQFNALGMTRLAVEMGAVSVDHLEASTESELEQLAGSSTFGVVLPVSGHHLGDGYAPARAFVDAGGLLALATNFNPGSAPSPSMPFAISVACRRLGLTPAEAITAATWNAACVLGLQESVGALTPGRRADLQLLDCDDEREIAWEIAGPGPRMVMIGGRVIHARGITEDDGDPFAPGGPLGDENDDPDDPETPGDDLFD